MWAGISTHMVAHLSCLQHGAWPKTTELTEQSTGTRSGSHQRRGTGEIS